MSRFQIVYTECQHSIPQVLPSGCSQADNILRWVGYSNFHIYGARNSKLSFGLLFLVAKRDFIIVTTTVFGLGKGLQNFKITNANFGCQIRTIDAQKVLTRWTLGCGSPVDKNGADMDATIHKTGGTPLWWAKKSLAQDHPVVGYLEDMGALNLGVCVTQPIVSGRGPEL